VRTAARGAISRRLLSAALPAVLAVPLLVGLAGSAHAGPALARSAPAGTAHAGTAHAGTALVRSARAETARAAGTVAAHGATRAAAHGAADGRPGVPVINWGLSGQASATSAESSAPASNAIDGDAGTDWCTSSWTGSLVIDLGQVRSLTDLGITMDATSPSASATIQVASQSGDCTSSSGMVLPHTRNTSRRPPA